MELTEQLKNLYRHWELHTAGKPKQPDNVSPKLQEFIAERISIWEKKASGAAAPYTTDPILSHFRFCNIYRELDRQTIEIHELLAPLRGDFSLWLLNMFYARMVARPETLRKAGLLSFDGQENAVLYEQLIASPRPRYGNAYVFPISVIQGGTTPTRELFIAQHLPAVMQKVACEIETWDKLSVYDGVQKVTKLFGYPLMFLWTEVLIDVAYQYPERIDLFARFPIGPGAKPTFAKLSPAKDPSVFVSELAALGFTTNITYGGKPLRLSAENWEGIGCEYRKYCNLSAGHGRRRLYKPQSGDPMLF